MTCHLVIKFALMNPIISNYDVVLTLFFTIITENQPKHSTCNKISHFISKARKSFVMFKKCNIIDKTGQDVICKKDFVNVSKYFSGKERI